MSRRAAQLAGAALAVAAAAFACNAVLGIEEGSPKPPQIDAALPNDGAPAVDGAVANDRCTVDGDCTAPNACYRARCDTALGVCQYALCQTQGKACSAGTCDKATSACGSDRSYGLRTTSYAVGAALGCKASPSSCVAAAFPFLFIGTSDDPVVLVVDDILATAPRVVPLRSAGFRPSLFVASGRRIWMLGDVQGTGGPPPFKLPVAWLDVPANPMVTSLTSTSATLDYPYATYVAFAAPNGALFVADNEAAAGFPVGTLAVPLPPAPALAVVNSPDAGPPPTAPSIPMYRLSTAPAGATIVASSGSRLVLHRFAAQLVNLVSDPGTPKASLGPDVALAPALPAFVAPRFGQGPDGTVFLSGPVIADPPAPDCNCTSHERLEWVFPNAVATAGDANQVGDFEAYSTAQTGGGACHQCSPTYVTLPSLATWIDAKTVLVAGPASDPDRTLTATRVLTRDPLAVPAKRRVKTAATDVPPGNFAVDHIALVSSNGFGYQLLADSEGNNLTLTILDPRCDAN